MNGRWEALGRPDTRSVKSKRSTGLVSWPETGLAAALLLSRVRAWDGDDDAAGRVRGPSGSSQTGHASRLQKLARRVVAYARHQVGVGYSWGGTSPQTGFDCSGLVCGAYRSIGWKLPRSSWDQLRVGRPVRFARLRPGDLLFTEGGGHVQLVVSKRAAISAPQTASASGTCRSGNSGRSSPPRGVCSSNQRSQPKPAPHGESRQRAAGVRRGRRL